MLAFHSLYPQAYPEPMRIPIDVLDVLVLSKPDWTSLSWSRLWESFSWRAWPQPLGRHKAQIQAVLQQSRGAPDTRHRTATSTIRGLTREGRTGPQHHQELLGHLHLEEGLADTKMADMARLQLVVRGTKKQQTKRGA